MPISSSEGGSAMKRICVILLLVLLLPGLLLGAGAALPEYYGESYYAELPAMVEKLIKTAAKATKAFQPLLAFFSFSQQEAMPME